MTLRDPVPLPRRRLVVVVALGLAGCASGSAVAHAPAVPVAVIEDVAAAAPEEPPAVDPEAVRQEALDQAVAEARRLRRGASLRPWLRGRALASV